MYTFFISVLSLSILAGLLSAIVSMGNYFLSNYGNCKIIINNGKELNVQGGGNLLSALNANKIFIPSACGGRGSCGLCKVSIIEGAGDILPTEEPYLTAEDRKNNIRLSCQVKIRNNIKIKIPEHLLSIKEYKALTAKIANLTPDMRLFRFSLPPGETINYIPGQYIQLFTPRYKGSNQEVYRAYSIASDPADRSMIELIIRLVPGGICTTYCFQYLKEGMEVKFNGPYGEFRLSNSNSDMIFVAGGSGIAPIRCMLYEMKNKHINRKAVFFFGANTTRDLCLMDEMQTFETNMPNFKFIPVVARPDPDSSWKGETGLVTEALQKNCFDLSSSEAYLCGSPGMIEATITVLKNKGMPEQNIFYDKFA